MDVLSWMRDMPTLFMVLTNVYGFDELVSLVCPTIPNNAPSTNIGRVMGGKPMKLTPEQHLLNFIMYLKHDNVLSFECF